MEGTSIFSGSFCQRKIVNISSLFFSATAKIPAAIRTYTQNSEYGREPESSRAAAASIIVGGRLKCTTQGRIKMYHL
jgi:hypothetical protein